LLAVDLDGGEQVVLLRCQVVSIQILGLNVDEAGADACRGISFTLHFEDTHTVIVASCEVVHGGVRCEDPIPVSVFSGLVDLNSAVQVPEAHCAVL